MNGVNPEQMGVFVLAMGGLVFALGGIVSLLVGLKRLFEQRPAEQQPLTRSEAKTFATRDELERLGKDVLVVKDLIDKQQIYMQTRFHDLANQIAPMPTQIAVLIKQLDKIDGRTERLQSLLEHPKEEQA